MYNLNRTTKTFYFAYIAGKYKVQNEEKNWIDIDGFVPTSKITCV